MCPNRCTAAPFGRRVDHVGHERADAPAALALLHDGARPFAEPLVAGGDLLERSTPRAPADLGCGNGAVLLMLAWRFPATRCVGIEAQPLSVALARRSLAWNGAETRCEVRLGDLRDDEWGLFVQATNALSDVAIHMDDTPSISALQLRGHAVGFIGAGVNDAPALLRAEVGVWVAGATAVAAKGA